MGRFSMGALPAELAQMQYSFLAGNICTGHKPRHGSSPVFGAYVCALTHCRVTPVHGRVAYDRCRETYSQRVSVDSIFSTYKGFCLGVSFVTSKPPWIIMVLAFPHLSSSYCQLLYTWFVLIRPVNKRVECWLFFHCICPYFKPQKTASFFPVEKQSFFPKLGFSWYVEVQFLWIPNQIRILTGKTPEVLYLISGQLSLLSSLSPTGPL